MFCNCDKKINELEFKIDQFQRYIDKLIEEERKKTSFYRSNLSLFDQVVQRLDGLKEDAEFYKFLQYWITKDRDE